MYITKSWHKWCFVFNLASVYNFSVTSKFLQCPLIEIIYPQSASQKQKEKKACHQFMKINDPQKSTFLGCNNKEKITRSIYIELKLGKTCQGMDEKFTRLICFRITSHKCLLNVQRHFQKIAQNMSKRRHLLTGQCWSTVFSLVSKLTYLLYCFTTKEKTSTTRTDIPYRLWSFYEKKSDWLSVGTTQRRYGRPLMRFSSSFYPYLNILREKEGW